jgi:hypothetical protein
VTPTTLLRAGSKKNALVGSATVSTAIVTESAAVL